MPPPPRPTEEEPYELGSADLAEVNSGTLERLPPRSRSVSGVVGWLLLVVLLAGAGAFAWFIYLPEHRAYAEVQNQLMTAQAALTTLDNEKRQLIADKNELEATKENLVSTVEQQDTKLSALTHAQDELNDKLMQEIKRGDVAVRQTAGELVVDVSDQILFDSGETELNPRGKEVLKQVGDAMRKVPDQIIQVGGHTDAEPIAGKLSKRYASNWELSAARATNVVHLLQEGCNIPGERLVAAGFSQFRPVGNNKTADGRRQNRRIEVTLLPAVKPVVAKSKIKGH